ncbi:hypothetical protein GP486_004773 [Trichoglossum hirsutum]|uniref:Uncharacterized protein n=1 Tax=Trichoglossum hirsutum TaxID=265104 RepID=A0A9P8RNG5_9PEZI|nr:hypothetical protein GP486_004773 [Trichoglossum hirsutum]
MRRWSVFSSGCISENTTTATTTSSSRSSTSGAAAASGTTTTPTSTSSADGTKLTPGAIAGISITASAVFITLVGGIAFCVISHKRVTADTAAAAAAAADAEAEAENDKSNITSTTGTPPLTQTPSRQSGRPYSIQSTRTPPSGYYAVPTSNPDAVHAITSHGAAILPPKKSDLRYSNTPASAAQGSSAAASSPIRGPGPRARRFSQPTPAGGRMSPAEEVPEGVEADGSQILPPVPPLAAGSPRGGSPRYSPPPGPPSAQGSARRGSPQNTPSAPSPAPSASGSASEMPAVKRFYGISPG